MASFGLPRYDVVSLAAALSCRARRVLHLTAPFPIVGVGASAGGVEALERFFEAMPAAPGMAFVVVTHRVPDQESMLGDILGRASLMRVLAAKDDERARADQVYVAPAGATLGLENGTLRVRPMASGERERTPIDKLFAALAEDQGEYAIGIVLSGSGSDGTLGGSGQ